MGQKKPFPRYFARDLVAAERHIANTEGKVCLVQERYVKMVGVHGRGVERSVSAPFTASCVLSFRKALSRILVSSSLK